jgi:hypothetical protein
MATRQLVDLWLSLTPHDIFDLGALSIGKIGSKWISSTILGGSGLNKGLNYLLDTTPLKKLLEAR